MGKLIQFGFPLRKLVVGFFWFLQFTCANLKPSLYFNENFGGFAGYITFGGDSTPEE